MAKTQLNVRISDKCWMDLRHLQTFTNLNQAEVVELAIDRMMLQVRAQERNRIMADAIYETAFKGIPPPTPWHKKARMVEIIYWLDNVFLPSFPVHVDDLKETAKAWLEYYKSQYPSDWQG